jgi:hypothetical protein
LPTGDLDYGLVDGAVIRIRPLGWLSTCFPRPAVAGGADIADRIIRSNYTIEE